MRAPVFVLNEIDSTSYEGLLKYIPFFQHFLVGKNFQVVERNSNQ